MSRAAAFVVAVAAGALAVAPLSAQDPLVLDAAGGDPVVHVGGVLDDPALRDAVGSGLPLRLRFRVELWRDRLFDELTAQADWNVGVALEPLDRQYLAVVVGGDTLGRFPDWATLRSAVEGTYRAAARPDSEGRYYYLATLEIETLSLSDLDELQRWLQGELEPAVRGGGTLGSAIGTGFKRLFIRILGLPARRYQARSESFTVPGPPAR